MTEYRRWRLLIVVCQAPGAMRVAGRRSSGTFAAENCPSDYRRWFAVATKCSSAWRTSTTRSNLNPCWMSARYNNDSIYITHAGPHPGSDFYQSKPQSRGCTAVVAPILVHILLTLNNYPFLSFLIAYRKCFTYNNIRTLKRRKIIQLIKSHDPR